VQAYEIVEHKVQSEGVKMVLDLLGTSIRQPCEPTHPHAHRKVRPLDVRRADVFALRMSRNALFGADALGRAVASDGAFRAGTIDFDEHAVVDIAAECLANGIKLDP
jgi:hypothetical protein